MPISLKLLKNTMTKKYIIIFRIFKHIIYDLPVLNSEFQITSGFVYKDNRLL